MRTLLALLVLIVGSLLASGCKGHAPMGRGCSATSPCPVDFACVYGHDGEPVCMAGCTINATVCMDGAACLPLRPGPTHVCYVGGPLDLGAVCTRLTDCVNGAICVPDSLGASTGTCQIGCNLDGTVGCAGGATCTPTPDMNSGYCP